MRSCLCRARAAQLPRIANRGGGRGCGRDGVETMQRGRCRLRGTGSESHREAGGRTNGAPSSLKLRRSDRFDSPLASVPSQAKQSGGCRGAARAEGVGVWRTRSKDSVPRQMVT
eukprot:219020-Rhodomonas_salina.1